MSVLCTLCALHIVLVVRIGLAPNTPLQPSDTAKRGNPCSNLSVPTCAGGFPAISAVLRHGMAGTDGAVPIGSFIQTDSIIQGHPEGLRLNNRLWPRVGTQMLQLPEPSFVTWKDRVGSVRRLSEQHLPVLVTNLLSSVFLHTLTPYFIAEASPGVQVGVLVLFPKKYWAPSTGLGQSVLDFTLLLRDLGATVVVAYINGRVSLSEVMQLEASGVDVAAFRAMNHTGHPVSWKSGRMHLVMHPYMNMPLVEWMQLEFSASRELVRVTCNATHAGDVPAAWRDSAFDSDVAVVQDIIDVVERGDITLGISTAVVMADKFVCRQGECELGVLFTDALLTSRPNVEIAVLNGGSLRAGWPAGVLKKSHVSRAMPYQNELCYLNLTGAELYRALEQSCSTLLSDGTADREAAVSGQFLQTAGLRYFINPTLVPYHRVTDIHVRGGEGEWLPMDFKRVYSVVTTNYVCQGGDGFTMQPHNNVLEASATGIAAAGMRHIKDTSPVAPQLRGNIVFDFNAPAMYVVKESRFFCSASQVFLAEWDICEECPLDEHPVNSICTPVPLGDDHTALIVGLAVAVVVSLAVPFGACVAVSRRNRMKRVQHAPRNPAARLVIVFTDIKKSTELWAEHHTEMTAALQQHHRICRELIETHRGYEVKTIGDAFMVAFTSPVDSVAFMLDLQLRLIEAVWPAGLLLHPACRKVARQFNGLRVRVGAHCGTANIVITPGGGYDYDGPTCNLAARVGDSGDGGQVVVTEELYHAVEPHLDRLGCDPDVRFLGLHSFKGIPGDVACYQMLPGVLSGRQFDTLRGVVAPPGRADKVGADNLGSVTRAQLTRAMQALRLWVTRDSEGVTTRQLRVLIWKTTAGDPDLQGGIVEAVMNAIIRSAELSQASQHIAPLSPSLSGSGRSFASIARPSTVYLRWPVVAEILRSLPEPVVVSLIKNESVGIEDDQIPS